MKKIDQNLLTDIVNKAKKSDRLRMNYNFHENMDDNVQRMLNALEPDTYLPPHRHLNPDKDEIFLVLSGSVLLMEFDNNGNIIDHMLIGSEYQSYAAEIDAGVWHSLISLEEGTVIYEVKQGPFSPISSDNIASWAPKPNSVESKKWNQKMKKVLLG
jgi:cupin fold WbuC family metalloprotein